jgi:hypothetical protein
MGSAPTAVPTGNAGQMAGALAKVREALRILEKTLPDLQHGSEPYNKVLQTIQSLSKVAPASAEIPGVQKSAAQGLMQDAQKTGMMDMLNRSMSPAGASAGAGGAPPGGGRPPAPAMPPSLAA